MNDHFEREVMDDSAKVASTIATSALVQRAAEFARATLQGDSSGHDWWHVWRVWQSALRLGQLEGADLEVVQLAALLHDIADWKFHDGDETAGPRVARAWLMENGAGEQLCDQVAAIIDSLSFKGAGVDTSMATLEGRVVQDADRLDAIGAIGVARAFAFGGHRGRFMHDPTVPPTPHDSFASYKKNSGPTINHFYEKLLLLKDRMQTTTGRQIADRRHAFLQAFLDQFLAEWDGADHVS